jgi:hypothetical protein
MLVSRAYRLLDLNEAASGYEVRAESFLEQFGSRLPEGALAAYLARPDVRRFRQQMLVSSPPSDRARRPS